jgi:hypothetical protein
MLLAQTRLQATIYRHLNSKDTSGSNHASGINLKTKQSEIGKTFLYPGFRPKNR